jgi:hypothetical protein
LEPKYDKEIYKQLLKKKTPISSGCDNDIKKESKMYHCKTAQTDIGCA